MCFDIVYTTYGKSTPFLEFKSVKFKRGKEQHCVQIKTALTESHALNGWKDYDRRRVT